MILNVNLLNLCTRVLEHNVNTQLSLSTSVGSTAARTTIVIVATRTLITSMKEYSRRFFQTHAESQSAVKCEFQR